MITILVTHEDQRVDRYDFEPTEAPIEIGRRSGNGVCIPNLSVSGQHARLFLDSDESLWIEDLGSTNGTWFNGQSITRLQLGKDDELVLGKVLLRVRQSASGGAAEASTMTADAAADDDASTNHPTIVGKASESSTDGLSEAGPITLSRKAEAAIGRPDEQTRRVSNGSSTADAPSEGALGNAIIEIKNGAKEGQLLPIDKPVTTLGRPGIQIAAIMRKPDGYFLMHIESDDSVDRPTLNRDAIGDEPVMLSSGDRLNVAGIDVEFRIAS